MKVSIVGAGIAGLSLAWSLSRRGHEVAVYEQGAIPNPISSSYDEHRITRHAYGTMAGYAALMPAAFRIWEELFADIGTRHYEPTGVVYFLRGDSPWYAATTTSLDAMKVGYRDVPLGVVPDRFPMINQEGLTRVVETDGAGMLFPIRILSDLTVLLAKRGVKLHAYTPVEAVDLDRATVTVGGQAIGADVVAVTAGAWVDRLVPAIVRDVVASRQAVLYLAPPQDLAEAWSTAPVMIDRGDASGTYTLPPRRGTRLKVGDHVFTREGDPDDSRLATDADLYRLRAAAAAAYRDLDRYAEIERKACYYTVEEHERFVVRSAGKAGWVVSACSGHGFKLQPLITDGVARAITGERDVLGVTDWAAGRIAA